MALSNGFDPGDHMDRRPFAPIYDDEAAGFDRIDQERPKPKQRARFPILHWDCPVSVDG
ncbi:hypothetical protein [Methylobacterium sp. Leaf125]|uniref:hypothetical protein n=1 Tax=Methylobacterium sp. Leaf125 TaxID=1736265 RepID=UPI000B2BF1F7|nr:hypothetical protein [Methylobacterium sp. Leaf125]